MLENILFYGAIAIACAIALLNIIAPLTKSDVDNKVLAALRWFEEMVLKTLIPQFRAQMKAPEPKPLDTI